MTKKKPDLSKMQIFGSYCYPYNHENKKLDPKCTQGIFVGYDKNSPAYLVYHPERHKIMKHRLVRFPKNVSVEHATQTESDVVYLPRRPEEEIPLHNPETQDKQTPTTEVEISTMEDETQVDDEIINEAEREPIRIYPQRVRDAPHYYGNSSTYANFDYCYKAFGVPQTYAEAIASPKSSGCQKAMQDELIALR